LEGWGHPIFLLLPSPGEAISFVYFFLDMQVGPVILISPTGRFFYQSIGLIGMAKVKPKYPLESLTKSGRKIDTIAAAAAKLFSIKGYKETSMEDIALAAKLSKGGMYHYFDSKEEILYCILTNFMDLLLAGLEADIGNLEDPTDKVRYVISHHVQVYVAHIYSAKALLNEVYNLSARKLAKIKSQEKLYFSIISGVLSLYVGHNLDKENLTVVTFNLLGMSNWIYSWYDPRGAINPERLSQIIFQNFISGLSGFQGNLPQE
jgi:AcrR family transcriptional regulator